MKNANKVPVIELSAGADGFRLGLEGWEGKSSTSNYQKNLDIAAKYLSIVDFSSAIYKDDR